MRKQGESQFLPGTAKHPQGRLFSPVGMHTGDPFALEPSRWLGEEGKPAHSDITAWHTTRDTSLAREDNPRSGDAHVSDERGRPMVGYGSAIGMHFGTIAAGQAVEHTKAERFSHPVRIPRKTVVDAPEEATFSDYHGLGAGASERRLQAGPGEKRWSDAAANYAVPATDVVEQGGTVAYANEVEDPGTTSYRTKPETTKTWSEDVLESGGGGLHALRGKPHPSLVHMAQQGYNPVASTLRDKETKFHPSTHPVQGVLPDPSMGADPEKSERFGWWHAEDIAKTKHSEVIQQGRQWHMAKGEGRESKPL